MRSKRLNRQLKKVFSNEEIDAQIPSFTQLLAQLPPSETRDQLSALVEQMPTFLDSVDESYQQLDEKALFAQRNLEISSGELTAANGNLFMLNHMQDAMVNSLGQGFLLFGADGICQQIYSKACEDLLETKPAGQALADVLKVPALRRESFQDWCGMLFEDAFDFEEVVDVAPKNFNHTSGRVVSLEFKPVYDRNKHVQSVVVIATDRTSEVRANQQAYKMQAFATMVTSILKDKNQFRNFVQVSREILKAATSLVAQHSFGTGELESIKRGLHTLKGTAGSFGVVQVKDLVHEVETRIASQHDLEFVRDCLQGALNDVGQLFESLISENRELFEGLLTQTEPTREIPLRTLKNFATRLERIGLKEVEAEFIEDFVTVPIQRVLGRFNTTLLDTAQKLGRRVEPIQFEGENFSVVPEEYDELLASFVHVFRNIAEHGIEPEAQRTAASKAPMGRVRISTHRARINDKWFMSLEISDDGAGIDCDRIRKKLSERGQTEFAEKATREEIMMTIFTAGFSTAKQVTEFSGRGVGLDAVKFEVEKLGGQVSVTSELNIGTKFSIAVPLKSFRGLLKSPRAA